MTKLTSDKVISLMEKYENGKPGFNKTGPTRDVSVSSDEMDQIGTSEYLQEIGDNIDRYNQALAEKRTFITPLLSSVVPFTRENLYLVCAYTGSGKSTLAANIAYPLWQEKRKILIISNEETGEDILFRIGCLHTGHNFNDYKKGRMPVETQSEVRVHFPDIVQYVKIVDVVFKNGLTTYSDGIKSALEQVKGKGYACAMIDYFQNIKNLASNPNAKTYDTLNDLRVWFGQYIKSCDVPIVLFAQLHSRSKRSGEDIDHRIKHCPDIVEPSTVIIEAVPNYEELYTSLIVHKDRFGATGFRIKVGFDNGRFVDYDESFEQKAAQRKLASQSNKLDQDYQKLLKSITNDD